MKRLEKGELSEKEELDESQEDNEPDYLIEENSMNKKKDKGVKPSRDDTFVPLNIYDLYEQANPRF